MSLYAIADLHLSLGTDKPMDVFKGWENYVEKLETNWRKKVTEEDVVVIAGDISWAMKLEEIDSDFDFIHRLPGKKIILKGNHDYWWTTRKKMEEHFSSHGYDDILIVHNNCVPISAQKAVCGSRGWMYNCESEADIKVLNREIGRIKASIDDCLTKGLEPILFLHYPPVYDIYICREIIDLIHKYDIRECYYGHIHGAQASKRAVTGEYEGIKMHLISCDYIKFDPLLIN